MADDHDHEDRSAQVDPDCHSARAPAKTFKACRLCRRLKMRCEGTRKPPCDRCSASGADCVFDSIEDTRKRKASEEDSLREEVRQLKRHVALLTHAPKGAISEPDNRFETDIRNRSFSGTTLVEENGLSPEQLSAPVNTVHDLAPDCISREASDSAPQSFTNGMNSSPPVTLKEGPKRGSEVLDDVVTKRFIGEENARRLFISYMSGSNPYLPLFEPHLDTFDKIRRSSPFLFAAILSVASRIEKAPEEFLKSCAGEVNRLSAESLFSSPARIESVQALLILAAWSEKSWFALGHAVNMAQDLGLHKTLASLFSGAPDQSGPRVALSKEARTWLILYHLEREIAFGTARESRFAHVSELQIRALSTHSHFRHLDLRFMSIIELVQMRENWQTRVKKEAHLSRKASGLLQEANDAFGRWRLSWDQKHEESGYDVTSFQRTSLAVQKNYAKILICCALLSELQRQKPKVARKDHTPAVFSDLTQETLMAVIHHLEFIDDKTTFRWHLKFSPTYSALTIAFSAALGLTIAKAHPDIVQQNRLLETARDISCLLTDYPNKKFHLLVESFLNRFLRPSDQDKSRATASQTASASASRGNGQDTPLPQREANVTTTVYGQYHGPTGPSAFQLDVENQGNMDDQYCGHVETPYDKQLETMLGLPPEDWFLDPFSVESFSFDSI